MSGWWYVANVGQGWIVLALYLEILHGRDTARRERDQARDEVERLRAEQPVTSAHRST